MCVPPVAGQEPVSIPSAQIQVFCKRGRGILFVRTVEPYGEGKNIEVALKVPGTVFDEFAWWDSVLEYMGIHNEKRQTQRVDARTANIGLRGSLSLDHNSGLLLWWSFLKPGIYRPFFLILVP